jgi:hypothetical protein
LPSRPRLTARTARYAALAVVSALVPGSPTASGAGARAATLIWACPAITATVASPGPAVSAARTAAAGLSPADAGTWRGLGVRRGAGGAAGGTFLSARRDESRPLA